MKTRHASSAQDIGKATPSQDSIFHFPEGLPAFEHVKQFIFMHKPETTPFVFMQALGLTHPGFVCIDPLLVYPGYSPELSQADRRFLQLGDTTDVLILSIVTVTPDVRNMTTNLQGPLVLNLKTQTGRQIITDGNLYGVRYRIWDALKHTEPDPGFPATTRINQTRDNNTAIRKTGQHALAVNY